MMNSEVQLSKVSKVHTDFHKNVSKFKLIRPYPNLLSYSHDSHF